MQKEIFKHITIDPRVRFGKPTIAGTRVPVYVIVGKIAGGMTIDEIMREFDLTRVQVQAALLYAAELVAEQELALA